MASEQAGTAVAERGVNVSVVRLPQVHDTVKQGLISPLIQIARQKGFSAYVGEGLNRWPAAHVTDVARLYRLAVESSSRAAGTMPWRRRVFQSGRSRRSSAGA